MVIRAVTVRLMDVVSLVGFVIISMKHEEGRGLLICYSNTILLNSNHYHPYQCMLLFDLQ